jgi:hypothetical protein
MRNLARISNYYNRLEAWRDWRLLAQEVAGDGYPELVEKYRPPEDAGWRKIDKAIVALRKEWQAQP